jgi:predicted O-methyltransferase YrrM
MIDYIGDVSREDAVLLRSLAEHSRRILEFGCGASTQIFAAYGADTVDSVETDAQWIDKTKRNLVRLGISKPVEFHDYASFKPTGEYDLIFVDGVDELRQPFALATWASLAVGGRMCFHDTRRVVPHGISTTSDVQNVCALIERFSPEVHFAAINQDNSNTTVIGKRKPLPYVDWMKSENRTRAQMGLEP